MTLLDIFESEVRVSPSAASFIQEDSKSFTYSQLDDIATYLGKELACAIRVAPVDEGRDETPLVAVMMTRGVGLVAAILGILKAGAAYVPVDPSFPPDRQTHIFSHSKCQVLITDEESLRLALSLGVIVPPTLVVDTAALGSLAVGAHSNFISRSLHLPSFDNMEKNILLSEARAKVATREDGGLAYVLYTSGSTGKPKGVMVKQAGVVNIVNWFADELSVGQHSRVLGLTTFCFDISVLEMFLPLVRGAALVMVNQSSQRDPFQLLDVIRDTGVTVVQATPTTFEMLFATGWTGDLSIDFLVGGEAFRPSLLALAGHSKSLRNVYGPTETTIWSSSFTLPKDVKQLKSNNGVPVIPIGLPISETLFYIVLEDETLPKRVAAIGEEGELWIGGVGVAKGYLHQPELTVEKFFKNPFGPGFVYRTGDIVKRLDGGEGDFWFVRRMDDQVKIDGFRIELAEIETVFATHDLLDKAVAVVREGKLVLYIKTKDSLPLNKDQLQDLQTQSARSLTHYMMPKFIVSVNRFPETANGKLDRKALQDPTEADRCDHSAGHKEAAAPHKEEGEGEESFNEAKYDDASIEKNTANKVTDGSVSSVMTSRNTLNKKAKLAMAHHICNIVEKVRGRRPVLNNSFASIGVDSLGAVMFIKYLSDSVGGMRIEPSKIYAPGVTIRSFAEDLYKRLLVENPAALEKLGIPIPPIVIGMSLHAIEEGEGDEVKVMTGQHTPAEEADDSYDVEEDEEKYDGYKDVLKLESSFEDILTSNRSIIEGIRGVFTFFVLYDHFHHPHSAINQDFTADTYLFIMISGFTTALQLRETPTFVKTLVTVGTREEDTEKYGQSGFQELESGNKTYRYVLQPRQRLNFRSFMMSRLVGLLPILWLGLLLNIPPWIFKGVSSQPMNIQVGCSVMYVVAMQSWWRPQCGQYGPNNLLYASILVNCFLIYSFIRLLIAAAQNHLMTWASPDLSPVTLLPPRESMKHRTWKQYIGDMAVITAYNRTNARMMFVMMAFFFLVGEGLFAIMFYNTIAKNALTFIPYFFVGVFTASVLENIHCAIWDWERKEQEKIMNKQQPGSSVNRFLYDVLHYSSNEPTRPWVHDSFYFSYFYVSQPHPPSADGFQRATPIHHDVVLAGEATSRKYYLKTMDQPKIRSVWFLTCCQIWRFFPDIMSISIGFLMSTLGELYDPTVGSLLWFIILPTVFLAYFVVHMLQVGSARYNLSRFFLESAPIATMGYASYAMYLFQRIALTFYAPYFYFGVMHHELDIYTGDPGQWFERLNGGLKFVAIIIFTTICWLVHRYYQDGFVTHLYAKFLSRKQSVEV